MISVSDILVFEASLQTDKFPSATEHDQINRNLISVTVASQNKVFYEQPQSFQTIQILT